MKRGFRVGLHAPAHVAPIEGESRAVEFRWPPLETPETDGPFPVTTMPSIIDTVRDNRELTVFAEAVEAARMEDVLESKGPLTVFAPTDEAFQALPEGRVDDLLRNPTEVAKLVAHHLVEGQYTRADLVRRGRLPTLRGERIEVETRGGVYVGGAKIQRNDLVSSNGICHAVTALVSPARRGAELARRQAPTDSGRVVDASADSLDGSGRTTA